MGLKIRDIEKRDIETVVAMCRAMSDESPYYSRKTFSENKVRSLITQIVTSWVTPMLGLIAEDEDGQAVGMIGAAVQDAFMCNEKFSTDFGVYVVPEHRGSSIGPRLVKRYIDWALAQGVKPEDIHLGISTGVEMERTVCLYERLGFKIVSYNMALKGTA
ncbi:MAG: GNAT family N-acetyltransferase [Alphaproteobacteria bacterium]|nr:GNAT family N-acetyltransferase [Alphaproteobacteria bacterium]